ncbi:MAG: efflux RND transporter permease subunit [Pirellulales bacterium]|nr:efflux RND transporter permease subunit [Pirellulales bacterium]
MLNAIIRFSLQHRLLVIAGALLLLGYGGWQLFHLPIDVFPDLNRPRVAVMTEAPGMAPEEVEALITIPLEAALNGATGVQAVRSSSGIGLSVVNVEFNWGTDIYIDRQIVAEKLSLVAGRMPAGVKPQLAPISSIMGQIMIIGLWSEGNKTSPLELRTLADWVVRPRLLTIPGVSQVLPMGGGRKQFQVLVNPDAMLSYGVNLHEIETALQKSNSNVTGGYLDAQGPKELLVRSLGRIQSVEDLRKLAVKIRGESPVLLEQVAQVAEGPEVKRGDSSAFVRQENGDFAGGPSVLLTVNKQPGTDTRQLTEDVTEALKKLKASLPPDIRIAPELYQQKRFIDLAIHNVLQALRDGGILVAIILFVFLLNFRTTFITLTAIPLSIVVTGLVFKWFEMSINTMTLGGLAVAIGELVDDAIVDVENIFRRLRENRLSASPKPPLLVVFQASAEIRNSIVFSTLIIVLVFIPLFALGGMEGRLFTPLGVAYIVSILASLVVSLTVTPVLSYWLLPNSRVAHREKESFVLRGLKWLAARVIGLSLRMPKPVLLAALLAVVLSGIAMLRMQSDFMPPFDEGVAQLNVLLPPGTSLQRSKEVATMVERRLRKIEGVEGFVARTGRAELDEHIIGVNMSEFIISFDPQSGRSREEVLDDIREAMADIPGIVTSVEQPLAHLISAMLSGVQAQVAIKLYGDDLDVLRAKIKEMEKIVAGVPDVKDLMAEPQISIPQLRIELDRDRLARKGLTPGDVNEFVETAMHGKVISEVLQGQRTFDLFLRLDERFRENLDELNRMSLDLPEGGRTPLDSVAKIYTAGGPNTINREQVRRRIVLQCNTAGRGMVDVVKDIQARLKPIQESLPAGYFIEYGGQFQSQQSASRMIAVLFCISLAGMFLVLFTMFRSVNFALQVMAALPMAFIGAVAAILLTGQTLTIAGMVGFISLCGIATRNGILLLDHYLHLVKFEGETWSRQMIIRAGQERLAPVLMTALTAGIGMVPLAMAAGEPGKEILYPVATVIIGGLISSTLLEFFVRPALFWTIGRNAGRRLIEENRAEIELNEDQNLLAVD